MNIAYMPGFVSAIGCRSCFRSLHRRLKNPGPTPLRAIWKQINFSQGHEASQGNVQAVLDNGDDRRCSTPVDILPSRPAQTKFPENFFLLRGNHECASITRIYGPPGLKKKGEQACFCIRPHLPHNANFQSGMGTGRW